MTQKKKPYLRILTPPDDLSEIMKKVHRFRYAKVRRILVVIILVILAICGTYLLMKNQVYGTARISAQYAVDISDTSNYGTVCGRYCEIQS